MIRFGKNKLVRAALVICVLMQSVAILPHHHHEGSGSVCISCFNSDCSSNQEGCLNRCNDGRMDRCRNVCYLHCGCDDDSARYGQDDGDDAPGRHSGSDSYQCNGAGPGCQGDGNGHAHHCYGHGPIVCNIHMLTITEPEQEDIAVIVVSAERTDGFGSDCFANTEKPLMEVYASTLLNLEIERSADTDSPLAEYLSVARPSRAPDLLA